MSKMHMSLERNQGINQAGITAKKKIYTAPEKEILEAFPNKYPGRNYVITFEHPEFTSLCPMTGQPDFGTIRLRYVPKRIMRRVQGVQIVYGRFP